MRFGCLTPAIFVARPNRFLCVTEIDGEKRKCFLPNPGRMRELFFPGVRVYLKEKANVHRKTNYDLVLVEHRDILVSVDSRVPNLIIGEAIENNMIPELDGLHYVKSEPTYGDSRFDLLLSKGSTRLFLEVKGCTLVVEETALFPDAPTKRGTKHLKTLGRLLNESRACIFFLVQRSDAIYFAPNNAADPEFGEALRTAQLKGVEVLAYTSKVSLEEISINKRVRLKI